MPIKLHPWPATMAALAALGAVAPVAQATFPGRNGRIVLQRPAGHQVDLFSVDPDGSGMRRLTHTATWEEKAEWSPDGAHLAFGLSRPSGEPTEIATTDADGKSLRVLTSDGSTSQAPTWSPDGRIAFFTLRDFAGDKGIAPAELYSMREDGTDQRRLTHDRRIQTDPEWSPDGRTIAYSQWRAVPGQAGVFDIGVNLTDADGTHVRELFPASARRDIATQSWSPDGKQLVVEFISGTPHGRRHGSRQSDIAVINADGTGFRRLTRTSAEETEPVWSPDGTQIAFAGDRHLRRGPHLERNGLGFELYTMHADGSHIRRITHNGVPDLYPDWQPIP